MSTGLPRRVLCLLAVMSLTFGAAVTACGKKPEEPPPPSPTATPTKAKPSPTPTTEADPWPLTGLPGPPEDRPALAIKVENSPQARPQAGLEVADIVWEEVVEGGISRFVVVFHSQIPDEVGPIRSVRPMDGPIAGAVGGLLVFSGGQPRFVQRAVDADLQVLSEDHGSAGFFREPSRSGEHSLFGRPAEFLEQANEDHQAPPNPEWEFAKDVAKAYAATKGEAVDTIQFRLSGGAQPAWTWDQATKTWLRSEGAVEAMANSGDRLAAVNLVALTVEVGWAGGHDAAGSAIPEMYLVGSGVALVAAAGKAIEVKWDKASPTDPVVLTDAEGEPVTLAPGNTWVELVPASDGNWTLLEPVAPTKAG